MTNTLKNSIGECIRLNVMKILIATGIFPPEAGGPATYAAHFAEECILKGHDVCVIAYGDPSKRKGFRYPVISIPRLPLPFRYGLFFFACMYYGFSSDVIFAQDGFSSGIPASFASLFMRKWLVVKIVGDASWEYGKNTHRTEENIDAFQKRTSYPLLLRCIRLFQWFVCKISSDVIVPSSYLKGIVVGWGINKSKISVIYNAAPATPPFDGGNREHFLFFSAGRLVSWKHFDGLIRAFARIHAVFPRARLAIAGDGPCRAELEAEARHLGAMGYISFLGAVSSKEMPALYARASCFVLFSSYEGLSHVLLEALAYQTPVIASDAGGNAELITDGINGMLVPSGDEDALASTLAAFLSDPHSAIPRPGLTDNKSYTWKALTEKTLLLLAGHS